MSFFRKHFGHSSAQRTIALVVVYTGILTAALFASFAMYFNFQNWENTVFRFALSAIWIVPLQIAGLFVSRHFEGMLSYFRMPDLIRLFQALFLSFIFILGVFFLVRVAAEPIFPLSVALQDFLFSLLTISAFRVFLRLVRERFSNPEGRKLLPEVRIAVLGAGEVGATVASDMLAKPGLRRVPVVFLDDDTDKQGLQIHGIRVAGPLEKLAEICAKYAINEVVIAIGNAPAKRIQEIITMARGVGVKAEIMPSLIELATGQVKASRVRPVEIQDLLGRESVSLDSAGIREMIQGKIVLVTGAGGSIGSELCRQIASHAPLRLLLVERCEVQLFQIEQNLIDLGFGAIVQPLVGDITDEQRMRHIFELFRPQIIFHAAAHKHVFLMERQPWEAVKNNALGTRQLANLANEYDVERFIFISTDKAINPTNIMGASKRLAEIYLQAFRQTHSGGTKFMAVRFGNVLGSSGSVIPIFRKQISEGGPVKVTHPDVTRYFMTIPEAVGLVLQCAILGAGGEIFVLDMGKPVKITDLARQMIELSGFRPDIDIQIEFVGLRAGEKLFEELQHKGEIYDATAHPRIMRFVTDAQPLAVVEMQFAGLQTDLHKKPANAVKTAVHEIVPEYKPHLVE